MSPWPCFPYSQKVCKILGQENASSALANVEKSFLLKDYLFRSKIHTLTQKSLALGNLTYCSKVSSCPASLKIDGFYQHFLYESKVKTVSLVILQMGSVMQHGWQLHSNPCLSGKQNWKRYSKSLASQARSSGRTQVLPGNPNPALIWVTFSAKLPTQKLWPMWLYNKLQHQSQRIYTRSATGLQ